MRLIDADALYMAFEKAYERPDLCEAAYWFFGRLDEAQTITEVPKDAENNPLTKENADLLQTNEPLTVNELLEMDGEPVFCYSKGNEIINGFGLVHIRRDDNNPFYSPYAEDILIIKANVILSC